MAKVATGADVEIILLNAVDKEFFSILVNLHKSIPVSLKQIQ
jgi:hypothetical protein